MCCRPGGNDSTERLYVASYKSSLVVLRSPEELPARLEQIAAEAEFQGLCPCLKLSGGLLHDSSNYKIRLSTLENQGAAQAEAALARAMLATEARSLCWLRCGTKLLPGVLKA